TPSLSRSFPTRRSSDLDAGADLDVRAVGDPGLHLLHLHLVADFHEDDALQFLAQRAGLLLLDRFVRDIGAVVALVGRVATRGLRSEEHTSELQSRFELV